MPAGEKGTTLQPVPQKSRADHKDNPAKGHIASTWMRQPPWIITTTWGLWAIPTLPAIRPMSQAPTAYNIQETIFGHLKNNDMLTHQRMTYIKQSSIKAASK